MENKIKILSIAGIIVALLIGSAIWDGYKEKDSALQAPNKYITIRYLYSTTGIGQYEFAEELGYLEKEGIKLERVGTTNSGPENIMALMSGSVNVGTSNWIPVINSVLRAEKLVSVVTSYGVDSERRDPQWVVLNDSGINSPRDLKGKKIAVNVLAAHADYAQRKLAKQYGYTIKDVQLIVVPPANFEQVLRSKQVDAVISWNPITGKILEGGGAKSITDWYEINGGEIGDGPLFFSEAFVKKNPEVVKGFVRATVKATDWSREHPKEANELFKKIIERNGGNPNSAKYWKSFGVREHAFIEDKDVQFWIDEMVAEGKLEKGKFKPSDFYTNEFNPYYKK